MFIPDQHHFTDTGFAWAPRRQIAPAMRDAIAKRVFTLESEQAATHWLIERLYELSDELTDDYLANQNQLRRMREILLNTRCSA